MDTWDLWIAVWQKKQMVAVVTLVFACAGTIYALLAKEWYRAEVLLVPAENYRQGGPGGQLGGMDALGSIAGLAGLALGTQKTAEPLAVLKSRELAKEFIESQKLLPIFFPNDWDERAGRWKAADPIRQKDIRDGVKYFNEEIADVDDNKKTGLVTLTVTWTDSAVAAQWANSLVAMANEKMRQRALVESRNNVEFLREELNATTLVPMQDPIGRLLEGELQKMMLARESKEFAFRIVDRADPPKYRYRPIRSLVVAISTFAGGLVAMILVLLDDARKRGRSGRK